MDKGLVICLGLIIAIHRTLAGTSEGWKGFDCEDFVVVCGGSGSSSGQCQFPDFDAEEVTVIKDFDIAPPMTFKQTSCGILANISRNEGELIRLMGKMSTLGYSLSTTFWLLSMSSGEISEQKIEQILRENSHCLNLTQASVDSYVFVFVHLDTSPNNIWIWECFFLKDNVILRKRSGQGDIYDETRMQRRLDFRAKEIIAVAAEDFKTRVEVNWTQDELGRVKFTEGFATSIFHDLRDSLNFKAKYVLGDWISQHLNETLKGKTYSYLMSGESDIMIGHTVMLPHRARQLRYLQPTYLSGLSVFLQQPPASAVSNLFLAPFNKELWGALLSIWMVTLALTLIMRMIKCLLCQVEQLEDSFDSGEAFVWVIGTICQQGWYSRPKTSSMKIVFLVASITASIVYMAYTATIVSVLSVERVPIKSLDDLFHSRLKMYASGESSTLKYYLTNLYKDKPELTLPNGEQPWLPVVRGIQNVLRTSMAFLSYNHIFHLECQALGISDRERCSKIYHFPVTTSLQPSGMTVPKNFSYAEVFNFRIIQFKEKGYLYRHNDHFKHATSLVCIKSTSRYRAMLGIDDTLTAYVILLCGHILSTLLLGVEVLFAFYIQRFQLTIRQRVK